MARSFQGPRKRRTRQHVIADQSVHHLEGFALNEGHTAHRVGTDYGYDLILFTYDRHGYVEQGLVFVQLKASESLRVVRDHYVFDLDLRDYNLWTYEEMPVILILYDASHRRAYWLPVQDCFHQDPSRRPRKGAKTVRVRIPARQVVNRRAIATIRDLKQVVVNGGGGGS